MRELVIDASNNDPIDEATFRVTGGIALIAKATEGTSFVDKTLGAHRRIAAVSRRTFGSYLFLHPNSPDGEATFYLRVARPKVGDIQPIIDAEVTNLGTAALARRVDACASVLENKGYRPLLYASSSIWQQLVAARPALKRLRVWEAQYPGRFTRMFPRLASLRVRLRHRVTVVMWQWTDAYAVNGHHYDASLLLTDMSNITIKPSNL